MVREGVTSRRDGAMDKIVIAVSMRRVVMGRDLNDMSQVIAMMVLIIAIGYVVDGLVFKTIERRLQHKWGLVAA